MKTEIRHRDEAEAWRPIGRFPGYEVSSHGRVRSRLAHGFAAVPKEPRVLRPSFDNHGYRRVYLRLNGRTHSLKVCWLVLEGFVGPRPDKFDACHNDGDRGNDCLANLRWDSRKANLSDRHQHGTLNRGSRNGAAKLSVKRIRAIRAAANSGQSQSLIAKREGIAQSTVSKIVRRERWSWVK